MIDFGISKALEKALPKSPDLGDFDRYIKWLRDSAFSVFEATSGDSQAVKNVLESWLIFIGDYCPASNTDLIALTAYCGAIMANMFEDPLPNENLFSIKSFFQG